MFFWLKGMEALHTSSYHEGHFEIKGKKIWVGPKNLEVRISRLFLCDKHDTNT
jgi:hypothetical protein